MNLWRRLLWLLATAWRRPPVALPFGVSRLGFRVWPHDLDTSLHMNDGRYWTLMDLGRTDLMLGSGLWRSVPRQRWTPVVSAGQIRIRRELRPFQAFDLETRLAHWDESRFVIEHRLVIRETGAVAAIALVQAGLYDRRRRSYVPVRIMLAAIGVEAEAPPMPDAVEAFLAAERALCDTTAAAGARIR